MRRIEERSLQWVISGDTGLSSLAIWAFMNNLVPRWGYRPPSDVDDFGRCVRLLTICPEWRDRLPDMAKEHPEWSGLISHWDELERLYCQWEAKERNDSELWHKTYELIQTYLREGK